MKTVLILTKEGVVAPKSIRDYICTLPQVKGDIICSGEMTLKNKYVSRKLQQGNVIVVAEESDDNAHYNLHFMASKEIMEKYRRNLRCKNGTPYEIALRMFKGGSKNVRYPAIVTGKDRRQYIGEYHNGGKKSEIRLSENPDNSSKS